MYFGVAYLWLIEMEVVYMRLRVKNDNGIERLYSEKSVRIYSKKVTTQNVENRDVCICFSLKMKIVIRNKEERNKYICLIWMR